MMKIKLGIFALATCLTLAAQGAVLFEEDFETQTLGATPTPTNVWEGGMLTVADGAPFGGQWLELHRGTNGWSFGELDFPGEAPVITLSFDAYFDATAWDVGYLRTAWVGEGGNINFADIGTGWDVTSSMFSLDTIQHWDMVLNISGSNVSYNGTDIAHGTWDVWIDGLNVVDDAAVDKTLVGQTNITHIGLWVNASSYPNGTAAWWDNIEVRDEAYYYTPPYDVVLNNTFDGHGLAEWWGAPDPRWQPLNHWTFGFITNSIANTNDHFLMHREGGPIGDGNLQYSGMLYTNGYRAVAVGETLEFSFDYTQYVNTNTTTAPGTGGYNMLDIFFTTNNITGHWVTPSSWQFFGQDDDSNNHVGFRLKQTANGGADGGLGIFMDPKDTYASSGTIDLNDIGISDILGGTGDFDGDELHIVYTAEKTVIPDIWSCKVSISNMVNGMSWTAEDLSYTNAVLYNATDIYVGMSCNRLLVNAEGFDMDNLYSRILFAPPPEGWEGFVQDYGLDGSKTAHGDEDGLNDWGEYVFGGDPTNSSDIGIQPALGTDGIYHYSLRGDSSITAHVMTVEELTSSTTWTTNKTEDVSVDDGVMSPYSADVGTVPDAQFIQLLVE